MKVGPYDKPFNQEPYLSTHLPFFTTAAQFCVRTTATATPNQPHYHVNRTLGYLKSFTWGRKSDPCPEEWSNLTDRKKIDFFNHHFLKSYENAVRLRLSGYIFARIARIPWINVWYSWSHSCFKFCLHKRWHQDGISPYIQRLGRTRVLPSCLGHEERGHLPSLFSLTCNVIFCNILKNDFSIKTRTLLLFFSFYKTHFHRSFSMKCVLPSWRAIHMR